MATTEVVVRGAVTAAGELILDQPPDVPAGRVEVTVRIVRDEAPMQQSMVQTLRGIWADLDAHGLEGRGGEQIVAEVRAMRDEWSERQEGLEALQDRLRAARERRAAEAGEP